MHLRAAEMDDAAALAEIYNPYAERSTVTFDVRGRTVTEQEAWLGDHLGVYPVVVAEADDGRLAGYCSLSPWRSKPAYRTSVEDSIYVADGFQGEGVGGLLLGEALRRGSDHGFHTVFARIVDGHEASIRLHQGHGFRIVGTEREVGRKFNRWLDVVVMQRMLGNAAERERSRAPHEGQ